MKILIVVGTRPNFIKITQFKKLVHKYPTLEVKIAHTGQHFDKQMADIFFKELDIIPDFFLNAIAGNVISQMTDIMNKLYNLIETTYKPDVLIVVGDVNSTLAASLVGNKLNLKVAHLESGLRSDDREMPEEVNRVLTDVISDYYFITEQSGFENLKNREMKGLPFLVGNTMIDTLVYYKDSINDAHILEQLSITDEDYCLVTLHRPSNVDNYNGLKNIVSLVNQLTVKRKVVFPIHPRTKGKLEEYGLYTSLESNDKLICLGPLDYFSFQKLVKESKFVVTDSGGIQEETTYYGVPCLTFRENTERPSTIEIGTNELISFDLGIIDQKVEQIEGGSFKTGRVPELWDGKATDRILNILSGIKL